VSRLRGWCLSGSRAGLIGARRTRAPAKCPAHQRGCASGICAAEGFGETVQTGIAPLLPPHPSLRRYPGNSWELLLGWDQEAHMAGRAGAAALQSIRWI